MAAEDIAKFALNSTLGTAEFAPLDKLFLKQKKLVASDLEYYVVLVGEHEFDGATTLTQTVKMINSGSVKIKALLRRATTADSSFLEVFVNGNEVAQLSSGYTESGYVEKSVDITFPANSIISFRCYSEKNPRLSNLRLCGHVVDTSIMEVNE